MINNQCNLTWYHDELKTTFQFVLKCGFITLPILEKLFEIKSARSLRRFAASVDNSKYFLPLLNTPGFRGWYLSRAGKYAARAGGMKPSYPPRITSRIHDQMALLIAIGLEQAGLVADWTPESQFVVEPSNRLMVSQDSRGQKYPDLVLTLPTEGRSLRVAIELELSQKSLGRYEKALVGYKAVRGVDAVIFAVNSNYIRASIETAVRRTRLDQNRLPVVFADAKMFYLFPAEVQLESGSWRGTFRTLGILKGAGHAV